MKKLTRWILAAAVAALVAGSSMAQRPQQPGRGQGGGGGMNVPALVVSNKDLQSELKISDEQIGKFKDVAAKLEEVNKKQRELFSGGQPDREKMQEVNAERTKVTDEVKKVVDGTLTDAQKKRIKQIEVQALGLRAFANEDVVKGLSITDEQKKAIKDVTDGVAKELADLRKELGLPAQGGGGGRPGGGGGGGAGGARPDPEKMAEFAKKSGPINEEGVAKIAKTLTADQQKQWKEMIGEKFDTSKLAPARPMRRDN